MNNKKYHQKSWKLFCCV